MRLPAFAVIALALALPAAAQDSYSSSTTTTTVTGPTSSSSTLNITQGGTSITGSTVHDSAAGSNRAAEDQQTLSHVVAVLASDPAMAGARIDVRVDGGNVTLTGTTRGAGQSRHAREIAQVAAGSYVVTSRLSPE